MKKVLMIIGGVVLGFAVLFGIIFGIVSLTSRKMSCESSVGNIAIMYNDDKLTGYAATGMSYDFDAQKEYAEQIGVEAYLDEFNDWFVKNAKGTCTRK